MVGKFFSPLLFWCCSWIRDPGWIKIRIRGKHPGSAALDSKTAVVYSTPNVCAGEVKPTPEGGNQKIKLKVRINPSGVFNVSSAAMIEKVEIEEEVPVQMEVRVPGTVPHG